MDKWRVIYDFLIDCVDDSDIDVPVVPAYPLPHKRSQHGDLNNNDEKWLEEQDTWEFVKLQLHKGHKYSCNRNCDGYNEGGTEEK